MRGSHVLMAAHVGRRFRELRGNFKQYEFARRLGVNQTQYNRYEQGKRLPPDEIIIRVAETCGLEPEQVIWGEGYAAPQNRNSDLQSLIDSLSRLVRLLDAETLEDLYVYLKEKSDHTYKLRRDLLLSAQNALDRIRRETGPG